MDKYRKVRQRTQTYIETSLQNRQESSVHCTFHVSPLATRAEVATTHDPAYIDRYLRGDMTLAEQRNVGFPWSPAHVNRTLSSVGGTVAAARVVVTKAIMRQQQQSSSLRGNPPAWAAHVAGGTHHAFYDYGEGFCIFSDMAVAANVVRQEFSDTIQRILLLDLDVHQGNGNARLFADRPDVTTVSLHCAANYFSPKEQSDLDIELPVGCRDETYLLTLQHWLKQLERQQPRFDLVFFQAGVDGLEADRLGKLSLTARGMARRNQMVYDWCFKHNLPLVICMGGGYPRASSRGNGEEKDKAWEPILASHAAVYTGAFDYLTRVAAQRAEASPEAATAVQG